MTNNNETDNPPIDDRLHLAAEAGDIEAMASLYLQGVDVNSRGNYGMTPLFYAVRKNKPDAVNFLLQRGARINAQDDIGNEVGFI